MCGVLEMVVIEEGDDFLNANDILERIGEAYSFQIIDAELKFRHKKGAIHMAKANLELLKARRF